ncbi:4634_t:CDS:2 [Rhizophagus irregularis]|nr:4634_t:CDS:2 [Rhizophagus irregularis]
MNKFFVLILLLVVNSKNFVQAQDPETCSTQDGSPCVKLNDLLAPCDTKFGPPPSNVSSLEYSVDNSATASCMCNQEAYDTLSSCISTCFSNENPNIKTANFEDYQRSCRNFGFIFGPPIKDQSLSDKNDTAGTAKKVLIGIFTSISFLIVLGLLIWYWNSKRSRAPKQKAKPQSFDDVSIHEQMTVHHPAPGSGTPVSSLPNADYNPTSHTGLFPPPGYFPPQPQQTPYQQPFQPPYPRPPPNRVPYQQPHHSRTNSPGIDPSYPRNSPSPPQNYYNPNNFYGGGGGY